MDIHRCRFVPYPPSTINALAFSQTITSRKKSAAYVRLAIGRANGDIEIWNPLRGAWLQETIFRGGKDRSVDGLVWIQDPDEEDASGRTISGRLRLFSIGYTTTVTEWDLEKGQPLRQSSGNHGEIWCLAAQPPLPEVTIQSNGAPAVQQWRGQKLVTGCTDGAVVVYSTADEDLKLERILVKPSAKRAKVISVVFQDRNIVVAGCTDSTIRIYDIRNSALIRSISLGAGVSGGPKEIIVWAVKCLRNGNIVSGDSTGEVRIWDGKTYTLMQRLKSHKQDVLSLATNHIGDTILSGGMDRRTIVYKQSEGRWAKVTHQRFHSHDVKTMATYEGNGMSIIASGGPDASPIIIPLRNFAMEHQRELPRLPQSPPTQSAPEKRLIMSWWDREVHIWHINDSSNPSMERLDTENQDRNQVRSRKLVAKVFIKGEANIASASLSSDGNLLAVSTPVEVKVFALRSFVSDQGFTLSVSKIITPRSVSAKGAKLVQFSPDSHWLGITRNDNRIIAARVLSNDKQSSLSFKIHPLLSKLSRMDRKIEKHILLGGLGAYDRTVTRMAFSSDSRILAVSDLAGYIDTWVLEGQQNVSQATHEDELVGDDASYASSVDEYDSGEEEEPVVLLGQHWIRNPSASLLPNLSSPLVVLSFRPAKDSAKTWTNNIHIPHPTRNNPHPVSHDLPHGEDRLFVITAMSKVHEFEVLKGGLSEWSRINLTAKFPLEFQNLKDQAMGCLWDIEEKKDRIWLYGSNWLWMFDLSKDFSPQKDFTPANGYTGQIGRYTVTKAQPNGTILAHSALNGNQPSRKRKRGHGTGAGDRVPDSELGIGMSRKIQMVTFEEENDIRQDINFEARQEMSDMDADDSDAEEEAGRRLLDGEDVASILPNGNGTSEGRDDEDEPPHWWHSYKYRPIMGIVPLVGNVNAKQGIEVALVEKPLWETELPPRYYGQEWEKPGV